MISAIISLWYLSISVSGGIPICANKSQFNATSDLYKQVAIIGSDDRKIRKPGDISIDLESAQGRIWCYKKALEKGKVPTRQELDRGGNFAGNATIAFEKDMAIVNRHNFVDAQDSSKTAKVTNCYFEHIKSGEIVQMMDAEFAPLTSKDPTDEINLDFAVVKLNTKIDSATPVMKEDILIETNEDLSAPIKVVSNYAHNNKDGNKYALTITSCTRAGRYDLPSGNLSNTYATDCDTGEGTSGATATLELNGQPKVFGIVSGETKKIPEGQIDVPMDPFALSTAITRFDSSIFDLYERLKNR